MFQISDVQRLFDNITIRKYAANGPLVALQVREYQILTEWKRSKSTFDLVFRHWLHTIGTKYNFKCDTRDWSQFGVHTRFEERSRSQKRNWQFIQVCWHAIRVIMYHWIVINYEILFYERGGNLEQSLCHLLLKLSSEFWNHQTICHSLWGRIRKWGPIFHKNHPTLDRLLFEPISILCEFLLEWNTRSSDVLHNFLDNQSNDRYCFDDY